MDALLLARGAPRVFTAHNVLRRGAGSRLGARSAPAAIDALIAHTGAGAADLVAVPTYRST